MAEESPYTYLDKTYLEGQLLATQTVLATLLNVHVFHREDAPTGIDIAQALSRVGIKISAELQSPAREGFQETMRWFDVGLTSGSHFSDTTPEPMDKDAH